MAQGSANTNHSWSALWRKFSEKEKTEQASESHKLQEAVAGCGSQGFCFHFFPQSINIKLFSKQCAPRSLRKVFATPYLHSCSWS